tara:strand:+ start:120 stop:1793 length:1674 start_codon:yes stop_codon:yes gene_type:complete
MSKANNNKSTFIVDNIDKIISVFRKLNPKEKFINNILLLITFIIFFVIFPSVYYLYSFKTFNLVKNFPILTIFSTLFLFFSSLFVIILKVEGEELNIDILSATLKTLYDIFYFFAIFVIFSLSYHISKFILYNSSGHSLTISFLLITLILALQVSYNRESYNSNFYDGVELGLKDNIINILKNAILIIPCLIVDFMNLSKKYISVLPKASYIIIIILSLIVIGLYIVPILKDMIKETNGITLIKEQSSLENKVLFMSQNDLKDEIIKSKPFITRKLLIKNDNIKTYLENTKNDEIEDLDKARKFEGFDPSIHLLDKHITYGIELEDLTKDEKTLIEEEMEKNNLTLDDFKTVQTFKEYILSLRQHDKYYELLSKIHEYNKMKNDFIYQETSSLVHLINRTYHIQDYNYHYGLSFWVYFDSSIKSIGNKNGVIMNYSDTPKLFYDYETNELKLSIKDCDNIDNCEESVIYKTKDILFQRWNNFVVNYNYGTLDLFINNNLVLTKDRVTPYIKNSFLLFGSEDEKLYNCGICNIKYYDVPLNLTNINDIYKNKNTPCHA